MSSFFRLFHTGQDHYNLSYPTYCLLKCSLSHWYGRQCSSSVVGWAESRWLNPHLHSESLQWVLMRGQPPLRERHVPRWENLSAAGRHGGQPQGWKAWRTTSGLEGMEDNLRHQTAAIEWAPFFFLEAVTHPGGFLNKKEILMFQTSRTV